MYQTSDETWQAYNYYGGGGLYSQAVPAFDLTDRSYKVSYNRPILTRGFGQEWDTWVFGAEFAMVQWLEQNGYDVTYFTGVDAGATAHLSRTIRSIWTLAMMSIGQGHSARMCRRRGMQV